MRRHALFALSLLLGCTHTERETSAPAPPLEPTHYLDEWFPLADARCRLVSAEPALTEPNDPGEGRVAEDLRVVDASLACEDAHGAHVSVHKLGARFAWIDEARIGHLPSTRTKLGKRLRDHVLFEVPQGREGLLRARTYDAQTGEPEGSRERGAARLSVAQAENPASTREPIVIAPWPRLHDRALDSFLDRLAHTLATEAPFETLSSTPEGHAAIASASALYRRALSHFAPKLLAVRAIEVREGQPRLTLTLESGPHEPPFARFELELAVHAGELSIVRLLDPLASREHIECAIETRELAHRAERARAEHKTGTFCNGLGTALPGTCASTDAAALKDALRINTRCGHDAELGLDVHEAQPAPSDFEVRLRSGRSSGSLDSAPRFAVTIARSGQVRFEGQQWVSAIGSHEGRTSQALLSALAGLVARLGFLERPAADSARCASGDERGDSFSVRALGRERTVRDRVGCRGGLTAVELSLLRSAIERVGALDVWTTPALSPFARDAEIWVVAAE